MNLSKYVKFTVVAGATAAGTTEVDSAIIDMSGFDGVIFVALLGAITANGVDTMNVEENTTNATGGMAAIGGAQAVYTDSGAGTASPGGIFVDVYRPQERYLRAQLLRTVANTVVDAILAIQYCANKQPTIHDVTTILAQALAAPTA